MFGTYCTSSAAFERWTERAVPDPGDVIFTREAPAGEACVVPAGLRVCLGQRTVLMKLVRDRYNPDFLVHMIYSGPPRDEIRLATQGSTVGHFNMDDIANMPVWVPSLPEQDAIVRRIAALCAPLEVAASTAERELSLLREYRTRLVSDVVTGKLDVRTSAEALSDDEPVEPLEEDEHDDSEETGVDLSDEAES